MRTCTILASILLLSTASTALHAQCALDQEGTTQLSTFNGFGSSVDFETEWGAVGAEGQSVNGVRTGAVTLYRRVGPKWFREQVVVGSDSDDADDFGGSVALQGDLLAVGAPRTDLLGAVYLFRLVGGIWVEEQKITRLDLEAGDAFGRSVELDGDLLVIGADREDSLEGVSGAGTVSVYRTNGVTYSLESVLRIADAGLNEYVRRHIDLDDERIIIGTPRQRRATVFTPLLGGWVVTAELTGSDSEPSDEFGSSVSIDGNRIAVGARRHGLPGATYLFEESVGDWIETQKLLPPTNEFNDFFGDTLHLAGDRLIVGARGVDDRGSAFLFERNGGTFLLEATIEENELETNRQLGNAVAISGDEVWVAAWLSGESLGTVFRRIYDGLDWVEASPLSAIDAEPGDRSGAALATFGDTLIVGAPGNSSGADLDEIGQVSIFTGDGPHWQRQGTLSSASSTAGERFGAAVAVTGDRAAVGAPRALGAAPETGALSIFERTNPGSDPDAWSEVARLTDPTGQTGDRFGAAVAISGARAVAGAPGRGGAAGAEEGIVSTFELIGNTWSAASPILPTASHAGLDFGAAVALAGDQLAIGAPGDNALGTDAGRVDLYQWVAGIPTLVATLTLAGGIAGDRFGASLSLDGDLLAIGAPGSATSPSSSAGTVAIYRYDGANWLFETTLAPPTPTGEGRFGASVSVRGDRILVGEPGPAGTGAGRAHSFELVGGSGLFVATYEQDPEPGDELGHAVALSDAGSAFVGAPGDTFTFVRSGVTHQFWSLLTPDCDGNGVSDVCTIENEIDTDCNDNGIPDLCDLANLTSVDSNGNGLLDECEAQFIRGDCNLDGEQNLADAIFSLNLLFSAGVASRCPAACDTNGDDAQSIADSISTLNFLFAGGPTPPAPFPNCGLTPGQLLCNLPSAPGCD